MENAEQNEAQDSKDIESAEYVLPDKARPFVASVQHPWNAQLPMVCLICGPVVAVGAEVETPVPVPVAVEVDRVLEGVLLPFLPYTLSRFPAPQYSVPLSLQFMLQSEAAVGTAPVPNEFPHQHSPPYSRPA
jgi:hypothetical protein